MKKHGQSPIPFSVKDESRLASMKYSKYFFLVLLVVGVMNLMIASKAESQTEETNHYIGQAFDLSSNQLLYTEEYKERIDENQHLFAQVIYRNPNGQIIVQKDINFRNNRLVPEFRMKDYRDGYVEGVMISGNSIKAFFKKNNNTDLAEKSLSVPLPGVADAGFHYFIQNNWDTLKHGTSLQFNLIVPAELDHFPFQVKKIKQTQWKNQEVIVYQLEVESLLLKMFVDPILLTYHAYTKKLLVYEGMSNINDNSGKSLLVRIVIGHLE